MAEVSTYQMTESDKPTGESSELTGKEFLDTNSKLFQEYLADLDKGETVGLKQWAKIKV